MKLAALTLTLLLLLLPSFPTVSRLESSVAAQDAQARNAELLKLEAQFKQIDAQADSVQVEVKGDKEASGTLNVSVERQVPLLGATINSGNANTSNSGKKIKTVKQKETLLNIDLNKVEIPDDYINAKIGAAFSPTAPRCGTIPGVQVSQIDAGVNYMVVQDYTYNSGVFSITALNGFVYDRASIPRIFWVLIDKDSLSNVAPLFHDLLYRNGGVLPQNQVSPYRKFSRKDTDDLFLELMTKCGVEPWRRRAAYQAVRKFSGFAWQGH